MLHGDRGESSAGRGRDRRVKGTVTSMPDDELPRVDEFMFHRDNAESSAGDIGFRSGDDGDTEPWESLEDLEDDVDDEGEDDTEDCTEVSEQ